MARGHARLGGIEALDKKGTSQAPHLELRVREGVADGEDVVKSAAGRVDRQSEIGNKVTRTNYEHCQASLRTFRPRGLLCAAPCATTAGPAPHGVLSA